MKVNLHAEVVMHELGHNLGLHHGGGDTTNGKPNYPSVMNYGLQFNNFVPHRRLDYSRVLMPDLDESALTETTGLQGPATRKVAFNASATAGTIAARQRRTRVEMPRRISAAHQ